MSRKASVAASLMGLGRFVRVFGPHVRHHWKLIGIGLTGLLAGTLMRILEPWPLKFVIDRITATGSTQARVSVDSIDQLPTETLLLLAAAALIAIASLRAGMNYMSTIGFALAGNRTLTEVRSALFRHLQNLSLRFHGKSRGGDVVVRMIGDVGMVQEVTVTAVLPLLGNVLILVSMFGVMFWLDPQLSLIAAATLPLLLFATLHRGKRIREAARSTRKREGALASTASESLSAIKTVQSLSLGDRFIGDFSSHNQASLGEGVRVKRLSAGLERGIDVLIAAATACILWYGATRVIGGKLSAGELLVFLFYLKGAFRPLRDLAKYGARLAKSSAAAERIIELFETKTEVRQASNAIPLGAVKGEIIFDNLSFSYEPERATLKQISCTIPQRTHVAIVGPSGSGKSTLGALVLRLYDPDQGRVLIDGKEIHTVTLESLRANISTVLQDTVLFSGSVRENIAIGCAHAAEEKIIAAARLANAHEFIHAMPDGYDTLIGERGVNLSNGQRQRIAIARAAMKETPILILDEPTTGLDPENERLVLEALKRLATGRTTLHITHRLDSARDADRILLMFNGELLEQGTHDELLARQGHYAQMLALPEREEPQHALRG
ncbi:MAG: ABC transporter ATP-binding protein [Gammaproteobacteria bacterium]|nr:ABC transporter ATP-binding protein [Gammaproteobacteria bacterium]